MSVGGYTGRVLLGALLICQTGCGDKSVGNAPVGVYRYAEPSSRLAAYSNVAYVTLHLNRDGTFSQEMALRTGESYSGTGEWRVEMIPTNYIRGARVIGGNWVILDQFMEMEEENVVRVTKTFGEAHQVGWNALVWHDGTNTLNFQQASE